MAAHSMRPFLIALVFVSTSFARPLDRDWDYWGRNWPSMLDQLEELEYTEDDLPYESNPAPPAPPLKDDPHWPAANVKYGNASGVAVDDSGHVYLFHRANSPWTGSSFIGDTFADPNTPNPDNVLLKLDRKTGQVLDSFGAGKFYIPHGLTVDNHDNLWVTDVASHQVKKFPKGSHESTLVLGQKLVPGSDDTHFCKPTDVSVTSTGDFFVSDGYCNGRIMKFNSNGELLKKWGSRSTSTTPSGNDDFNVPHSLTLIEKQDMICVADREHKRIQCFRAGLTDNTKTGEFIKSFNDPRLSRVFAISYDPNSNVMYSVSSPLGGLSEGPGQHPQGLQESIGYTLDMDGHILESWKPSHQDFDVPHDVAVSPDGSDVFVGEVIPNKIWKFSRERAAGMVG